MIKKIFKFTLFHNLSLVSLLQVMVRMVFWKRSFSSSKAYSHVTIPFKRLYSLEKTLRDSKCSGTQDHTIKKGYDVLLFQSMLKKLALTKNRLRSRKHLLRNISKNWKIAAHTKKYKIYSFLKGKNRKQRKNVIFHAKKSVH